MHLFIKSRFQEVWLNPWWKANGFYSTHKGGNDVTPIPRTSLKSRILPAPALFQAVLLQPLLKTGRAACQAGGAHCLNLSANFHPGHCKRLAW